MSLWWLQILPKNEQKQVDLRFHSSKVECVCPFFEGKLAWKTHFDFFWHLLKKTCWPFRMRILNMDHSVCRARQYYFSNLRIECCCYNFSESVNSHSFICPTAKVHLWVWQWDQNIFEVKFELFLKFKRSPIIFQNSCQISSFLILSRPNWIQLDLTRDSIYST